MTPANASPQAALDYDAFVSCARADVAWVQGFLIPALGLAPERVMCNQDIAGAAHFRLGESLASEYQRAVTSSRYALLVLSLAYLSDEWNNYSEQLVAYLGVSEQRNRLIPLKREECRLPLDVSFRVSLDFTDTELWDEAAQRLREHLELGEPPAEAIPCPYPGMVPFEAADARFFYGREEEVDDILRRLRNQPFLWIIGPSGSGKSSLVRAGVLPKLMDPARPERRPWLVRTMRPGRQPTRELAAMLGDGQETLPEKVRGLLSQNPPAQRLLLVVDQFEEVFSQAEKAEQASFVASLKSLREAEECVLMMTLRADFYSDLMNTDVWPEPNERIDILPLRGPKLRAAIERPAMAVSVFLEAGLVERLLADAADEPGVLPLVQETMEQLWEQVQRRYLPLKAYEQMGTGGRSGLAVAVASKADGVLARLSEERRAVARRIFLRLVQFGEGRADTRRQQSVAQLASVADPEAFGQVLDLLTRNRLLTTSEGAGTGKKEELAKIDLSHETLITGWPTLRQWIDQRREGEKARRRLEERVTEWRRLGGGDGALLDAVELRDVEQWINSADAGELGFSADLLNLVGKSREAIERAAQLEEAARLRELEQTRALAEEQRKRRVEAEYRLKQAEHSELRAQVEQSYARAERNRLRALREQSVAGGDQAYIKRLNERAGQFERQARCLWEQAGILEKELRNLQLDAPDEPGAEIPNGALFGLEVVPSARGIGLLVQYSDGGERRLAVMRGGPQGLLRKRLAQLESEAPVPIELAVISHFDADDVDGIADLLEHMKRAADAGAPPLAKIKTLWFNHFFQLFEGEAGRRSKKRVTDLAPALGITLNEPFDYFVMPSDLGPARVMLTGGLCVTVLTPEAQYFRSFYKSFEASARQSGLERLDLERGIAALSESFSSPRIDLIRPPAEVATTEPPQRADLSNANLASIVTLLEFANATMLFCADSRCDHILKGLAQAGYLVDGEPLHVDVMVLPHGGSRRNVTRAFFERVTADHYIVPHNPMFKWPDLETLQMLGEARKDAPFTIHMPDPAELPWLNEAGAWRERVSPLNDAPVMIELLGGAPRVSGRRRTVRRSYERCSSFEETAAPPPVPADDWGEPL